jgi:hypothetical protein
MPTLKAQLRDLRAANVAKVEFFEDGALKRAEFFPAAGSAPGAKPESTAPASMPFRSHEVDLLGDVVLAPQEPVVLDASDFPAEVIESTEAETEADAE